MTDRTERASSAFRLNLEQQKNRAKELLRAAEAGVPEAQARLAAVHDGRDLRRSIPYCLGPVTTGPDRHELMARFLVDAFPDARGGLVYERELEGLRRGEEDLQQSADNYERVVLWMEHDSWDQLVLVRLLAHYSQAKRPGVLELIAVSEFPGAERFIGLGQLPPEGLRLLWSTRSAVTPAQLSLGNDAWAALTSDSPECLGALARSGTPALPIMAPALHRHLRELPSIENGLSLTETLVLQILSHGSATLNRVFLMMAQGREPLPWIPDLGILHVVDQMLKVTEPVLVRTPPEPGKRWFLQLLAITDMGRAVLSGGKDWHSLLPPPRWVGGVRIQPGVPGWRWDEARRAAIFRE